MAESEKTAGLNETTGLDKTAGFDETTGLNETTGPRARRRGPDAVTLLVGLLTLGMAAAAFVGEVPHLSGFDPRWLLAGGLALLGVLLLVGSLRGRR